MDFFESEEIKMKKNRVQHVLTGQRDILTLSNNYTKQLDKIDKAERADCNLPKQDVEMVNEERKNDTKIIRKMALTVAKMKADMEK